jgi:hypothetical protein
MAGIARVHGAPAAQGFYGLQPVVVKIARSNVFTADTGGGTTEITEGGYTKGIRALQTVASIVMLGAKESSDDSIAAIVDGATFNNGAGLTTAGTYGALKDALVAAVGGAAGNYTITVSSELNGDGTFTFA